MGRRPWPNPADTTLDRARSIARGYRDALHQTNPALCAVLDRAATEFGETWAIPQPDTGEEFVTRTEAGQIAHVHPDTISRWAGENLITRHPNGLYLRTEIEAVPAARRQRRSARHRDQLDM